MNASDDEVRLISLFRALPSPHSRGEVLQSIASQLLEELLPDSTVYDFMPDAAGFEPRGDIYTPGTSAHIIFCAAEATGDPAAVLLGPSDCDATEAVPRFAAGASAEALEQGSWFRFDEAFAREYIAAWRMEIVRALVEKRRNARSSDEAQ
jgi:hypothetical protein